MKADKTSDFYSEHINQAAASVLPDFISLHYSSSCLICVPKPPIQCFLIRTFPDQHI